jgi:hypothetical protein
MRCEDCLPLLEEYFDGEVTGQAGEQLGAHLATCTDCSAALDALSFEQEMYTRYDRGGLEVTPELWARVSAEIARTPTEVPGAGRPFLSRARAYFAAALGTLAVRPALASALALLVVAAAAGTLWLSRRTPPSGSTEVAVQNTPALPADIRPPARVEDDNPKRVNPFAVNETAPVAVNENAPVHAAHEPLDNSGEIAGGFRTVTIAPNVVAAEDEVEKLLATPSAPPTDPGSIGPGQGEHAATDEIAKLFDNATALDGDLVTSEERMLDPEQKDVARHVERAQMLLRSIKNVRASDAGGADIAYEKSLSRKLLAENATLQLEAEVNGDKETKQVLDRIEPFLLEIANMGEKPSREEVRSIRERVRSNEIVAALEVY